MDADLVHPARSRAAPRSSACSGQQPLDLEVRDRRRAATSVSSETRVGSSRSRPIGASIRPDARARPPARRARGTCARARDRGRDRRARRCASSGRARRPSGPMSRSRRCDDPGPLRGRRPPALPASGVDGASRARSRRRDGRRGPAGLSTHERDARRPRRSAVRRRWRRDEAARPERARPAAVGSRHREAVALRPWRAVDEDARPRPPRSAAAREPTWRGEEAVETLAAPASAQGDANHARRRRALRAAARCGRSAATSAQPAGSRRRSR